MGGSRGRLISSPDRRKALQLIREARHAGARLQPCCEVLSISTRTHNRWQKIDGTIDKRKNAIRKSPRNKLSDKERKNIINVCNQPEHADLNPSQIVPRLATRGHYIASESTFYRVLRDAKQNTARKATRTHQHKPLATHIATGTNEVWTWDITWLPGPILGQYYKLYLIVDLYSRFIVQWELHKTETQYHAMELIKKATFKHKVFDKPLVLHSDNGAPMKGQDFQSLLVHLGVTKSYSRPRVSNDNAYSEALFRTLKYTKDFPNKGFASIDAARTWVDRFVGLYNTEFLHSGIKFVTPYQRHYNLDREILQKRTKVYEEARRKRPERWSGKIRDWSYIEFVTLNPVHKEEVEAQMRQLS